MKILKCHNAYQQPGGEDRSFEAEVALLESRGHDVIRFTVHNDAIRSMSRWKVARRTLWNPETYEALRKLIRRERPGILHCTNTFPLMSPAACWAGRREGLRVVQSLRNYRLLCPNALLLRDGRVCEDCLGRSVPWPGVVHACYRGDRAASAVVATMLTVHRAMGTWARAVDAFVTPSEFARKKFIEAGLPADRIAVKPNFVDPDLGAGTGAGGYAAFVGRLASEKGLETLLSAWPRLDGDVRLKIVGDGPLAAQVRRAASEDRRVEWLGRKSVDEVQGILGDAACLVMPSECYETFGRAIVEAFARGTPVIASRLGAMEELVADGENGLLFAAGDPADLAAKIQQLLSDGPKLERMRRAARLEYERRYTGAANYSMLMSIYERVLGHGAA